MHEQYLMHWGIKGQKWGIRRYQNPDGTYTSEGKRRRRDNNYHEDYLKAHTKKDVSQMSDRELMERNRRLQMEKQYKDLTKKRSKGVEFAKAFIKGAGTLSAVVNAYGIYKKNGKIIAAGILMKAPDAVLDVYNYFSEPNKMAWDYDPKK